MPASEDEGRTATMRRLRHDTSGRLLAGLAVTVGLLLPLAVFGAPAFARTAASASEYEYQHSGSSQYEYSSAAQYQYRMTICHYTHSKKHPWHLIRISSRAWPAHQRHGDTLPPCSVPSVVKHNNGKGHGHGAGSNAKGKNHGNGNGQGGNGD
jgi:hypothetical protein